MTGESFPFGKGRTEAAFLLVLLVITFFLGLAVVQFGYSILLAVVAAVIWSAFLYRPVWGLLLIAVMTPVENLWLVGGSATGVKVIGMGVFGAWLVRRLLTTRPWKPLLDHRFLAAALAFIGFSLASVMWASYQSNVLRGTFQLAMLMGLSLIVIDLANTRERIEGLYKAILIGALLAAFLTIEQFYIGGARRAGDMISGGINATSAVLITVIPVGFYFLWVRTSKCWTWLGLIYVGLAIIASAVTFARMSFLVLPPLLFFLMWSAIRSRRSAKWVVTLVLGAGIAAAAFVPWSKVVERAETISPALVGSELDDAIFGERVYSGRVYHYRIGLAIFRDHPIIGVGYNNYGYLFLNDYQFKVPGAPRLYEQARSPHSSYLGIVADLGIVGTLLWVTVLWVVIREVLGARKQARLRNDRQALVLVKPLVFAFLLQVAAYGWYLPNQRDKLFWLLLGMCVAAARLLKGDALPQALEVRDAPVRSTSALSTGDLPGPVSHVLPSR